MDVIARAFSNVTAFLSDIQHYFKPTPWCPEGPFRLLDLPPELRVKIYEMTLPNKISVRLESKISKRDSQDGRSHGLRWTTGPALFPCHKDIGTMYDSIALMKACHTTHREMGHRFYKTVHFTAGNFSVADRFQANLAPAVKPLITELWVEDYAWTREFGEKEEKVLIQSVVQGLSGLHTLEWLGMDMTADAHKKGTAWKPQGLRKLKVALEHSARLRKAFYFVMAPPHYRLNTTTVKLTVADGVPAHGEPELDVDGEYQKWLRNRRI